MERSEAHCVQVVGLRHHGPKTRHGAEACKRIMHAARCEDQRRTESPHAAATPMMARMRKWTARCPAVGTLSATMVFCSVLVSFFCLVLVVLVFWVLVRVPVFCSILTWNEPNLLCRAKT